MAKVYFSSLQQIKDNTLLDTNIQDKNVLIMQRNAENNFIQETLGTDLYVLLKQNIQGNTLTAKQRTLIESYILPYEYALIEMLSLDELLIKISDSIYTSTPPNTIQRTKDELNGQKAHKERSVNTACGFLKNYIMKNIKDFPQYETNDNGGIPAKITQNYGFYCDDSDYYDDDRYNTRRASQSGEESI
jgi:hypothetical protein